MIKLEYFVFVAVIISVIQCEDQCQHKKEHKLFDHDFGITLTSDDLFPNMTPFVFQNYLRPCIASLSQDFGSTIKTDNEKFVINLDVQHFTPDEITVKTSDGQVTVQAKHEEIKDEHGFVSRQFVRRYNLPEGIESDKIASELSSHGILTISAPKTQSKNKEERVVHITHSAPGRKEP